MTRTRFKHFHGYNCSVFVAIPAGLAFRSPDEGVSRKKRPVSGRFFLQSWTMSVALAPSQQSMKFSKVFLSALIAASAVYVASAQTTITNTFWGLNRVIPDGNPNGVSFYGVNRDSSWTLVLADLDLGDQSTLTQWGVVITAVPEPSTFALAGLGGLIVAGQLRRKRRK